MRALYQRKQGRDLFDLATALRIADVRRERIVEAFLEYLKHEGGKVTRAQFEQNLAGKLEDPEFAADISPLLADGFAWKLDDAVRAVQDLIILLPGAPWRGGG